MEQTIASLFSSPHFSLWKAWAGEQANYSLKYDFLLLLFVRFGGGARLVERRTIASVKVLVSSLTDVESEKSSSFISQL